MILADMSVLTSYGSSTFVIEPIVMECFVNRFGMQHGHARAQIVNTRRARLAKEKKRTVEMGLNINTD